VTTYVIAKGGAEGFFEGFDAGDDLFGGQFTQIGPGLQSLIGGIDVGLVVFGVMDLHRLSVDVGREGVVSVAQGGQGKGLEGGFGVGWSGTKNQRPDEGDHGGPEA
jgi:hypothetical protein